MKRSLCGAAVRVRCGVDLKQCSACSWYPSKDFFLGMRNLRSFLGPQLLHPQQRSVVDADLQLLTLELSLAP